MDARPTPHLDALRRAIEDDLLQNVLPFWRRHGLDRESGGMTPGLTNALEPVEGPRSVVLCARMLWTFSVAAQRYGKPEDRTVADYAYRDLTEHFLDSEFGGFYWHLHRDGTVASDQKSAYGQAFALYGLSEYARLTGREEAKEVALRTFAWVQERFFDAQHGGYRESADRTGEAIQPHRTRTGISFDKTHNTQLHMLEALTALRSLVPGSEAVAHAHRRQLELAVSAMLHPQTGHFSELTLDDWTPAVDSVSFGHDIEACWLAREADHVRREVEGLGPDDLTRQVDETSLRIATSVTEKGLVKTGSLPGRMLASHPFTDPASAGWRVWWVQAEAVVGFVDAWQLSGDAMFLDAATEVWSGIEAGLVDRRDGDWFKTLDPEGNPVPTYRKLGPWECPYHHARMGFEVTSRSG